jgi:hypothetical protein
MDAYKRIKQLFKGIFSPVVVCSNKHCRDWTPEAMAMNPDPRKRWMVNQFIGDEQEHAIVTLCPRCVKDFFCLTEKSYKDIERGEKLASSAMTPQQFFAEISEQ